MTTIPPFFSIVIPTYNRSALVVEAVESVLRQTFSAYEIIVVDDGSTDDTLSRLEEFNDNTRIKILTGMHDGAETSRNRGTIAAHGAYIVYLDSDDTLSPDALAVYHGIIARTSASLLIAKGTSSQVLLNRKSVEKDDKPFRYSLYKNYCSKACTVWLSTSFIVVKRDPLATNAIRFQSGTFPVDDLDFLLRAGNLPVCCIIHTPATVYYRLHNENSVRDIPDNLSKLHVIMDLEKQGAYPGGRRCGIARKALIGGHVQSWGRKALKAGLLKQAFYLFVRGMPAILALAVRKITGMAAKTGG